METFEGKCDPQRLAKLEKRVGAADTPQESFHKSIILLLENFSKFSCKKISYFPFENSNFQKIELIQTADCTKNQKFILINLSNDNKATIVATSIVTPDLMAQDGFTIQDLLKIKLSTAYINRYNSLGF